MRQTVLLLLIFMIGCSKEQALVPKYEVSEALQPFVDSFIYEAAQRGHSVQITNLIMKFDNMLDENICGNCNSSDLNAIVQKIIRIKSKSCSVNPSEFEALVFHELGHCILGRVHDITLLPSGDPKTIMFPNNVSLYSPCEYMIDENQDCNKSYRRQYYIDELFNENTPIPDWGH